MEHAQLCYDARHVAELCLMPLHPQDGHPECPQRLAAIQEALATLPQGAVVHLLAAQELSQWHGGRLLDALQLVHPIAYLQQLESICSRLQVHKD